MSSRIADIDELRLRLDGEIYGPGEPLYEDTCSLFNSMIERRPALVARCSAADDVAAALAFARDRSLEVTVRAGGHSVAGLCLNDGGIVIDIQGMNDVTVSERDRTARVGGGATGAELDRETQRFGLATTGGRVSSTGVGGLTLGGGSGWLERQYGFACDNLLAVEMVTAAGEIVRASKEENPELFWALRGGGGNFGVATAFEFRLHPVGPEIFGGMLVHPFEHGPELMRRWRDIMLDAPEGLSLAFAYHQLPEDDPELPEEVRGQYSATVVGMFNGPTEEGERLIAPLRDLAGASLDIFGEIPYVAMQSMLDDPPGYRNYWTEEHMVELPEAAIEKLYDRCAERPAGLPQLFMPSWGGAVSRVSSDESPLGGREARFIMHPMMLWEDPADDAEAIAWARAFREDMAPFSTGGAYLNFTGIEEGTRTRAQYGHENFERLARVKAEWDPENVFRARGNPVAERSEAGRAEVAS